MIGALIKEELTRSKEALFWFVLFPTLLTVILSSIFGNIEKNLNFNVGIFGNSKIIDKITENLSDSNQFNFIQLNENFEEALLSGKVDVVIKIPDNFDSQFQRSLILSKTNLFKPIRVELVYIPEKDESKITKDVISQILTTMDIEYFKVSSSWKEAKVRYVEKTSTFNYYEYLFPAVIVMSIMSVVFFGYTPGISFLKKRGVLKRFAVTPYSLNKFYLSYTIIAVIQVFSGLILLYIVEASVYKVNVFNHFQNTIFYSLFGIIVFLALGYMMAVLFKNPESTVVLGNILFQVFMFMGGFYFNVKNSSPIISFISSVIPSTYIVDALRIPYGYSVYKNHILVPSLWLLFSILIIFLKRNKINDL
ncbi:ABC transporter permease [Thermosipho ferrireducens]|uniref:ABC transporter permease n=1 Tax=Thermosipho ferrireducens TaxID=2571116 RepID=A0ABX7S6W7_9BACT|nr:ABC transporter permease [Thermosipho ferrireducens]QTA37352.1 ABC transporter permease [Thermosipho ferrireducens]